MKKLLLMCLFLSFQTQAQDIMQQLQDMIKTEPNVEINLGAGMLGLLSGMSQSEGEVADVMKNLTEIVVRVYELDDDFDGDVSQIKSWVNDTANGMKASGFQQLAAIREDDSTVFILAEMGEESMKGLSVMALDDESELVVIKIGGQILLKDLGVLMNRFNVDISDIDIN